MPEATVVKGPKIFLDYDQAALDAAYDQTKYATNREQLLARNAANSAIARAHLGEPKRFAYGPTPVEGLDVFCAKQSNAPINVFIHGGAWRNGNSKSYSFLAELFVNAGVNLVILDFTSVIDVNGDLMVMADQVRRGIAWVYKNASQFGGDVNRLYVSGHSSGGHLCGVALTTDWTKYGLPPNPFKGGLCGSGMYDLYPVSLSARSSYVKFTDTAIEELSSLRHLDRLHCPVVVAYGTLETPEFQRQNRDFAVAVKAAGKPVQLLVGESYNHFEMLETLATPYGLMGRAVLQQMGVGGR